MSAWFGVLWPIVLTSLLVTVPGLVVALAGGFRREAAAGAAPALSLGVLAMADIAGSKLHLAWGLPVIAGATVAVAAVALGVWRLVPVVEHRLGVTRREPHLTLAGLWWWAGGIAVAALVGGYVIAHGIGTPDAINQTYDAPFHVNAIELVAQKASAAPDVVASASSPDVPAGFYPPLFHGIAGLVVMVTGASAIVAANVLAVVIAAVIWPLSMAFLVRTLLGASRIAHLIAMAGSVLVAFFPALLLTFGVLWPNALSIATLPAVVGLGAVALGIAPFMWMRPGVALAAAVATLPGLYYAHPGAAFVVLAMAVPMVAAAEAKVVRAWWPRGRTQRRWSVVLVVGTLLGAFGFWKVLGRIDSLAKVRSFDWPKRATPTHALGEVIGLGSPLSPDLLVFGLLVLIGLVVLVRTRLWWFAVNHVVLAWLAILAIAYEGLLSQRLTGFWYNDPFRIMAPLAVTAVPLAAAGALAWRDDWARRVERWVPATATGRLGQLRSRRVLVSTAVVVALIAVLIPGKLGTGRISKAVSVSYALSKDQLVGPRERVLYASLAGRLKPGQSIIGNPWGGEVYAGVLSGHPVVWPHLSIVVSPDRELLKERFKEFTTDPQVCAAVKRLKVGVVVEDTNMLWQERDARPRSYTGLTDLAGTPGLTLIGRGDSATAYAVGDCSS